MQSVNETLDMEMSPQPNKRRRSSILKAMDRRPLQRDSRTVSFNITKIMADENMEITTMEIPRNDQTITSSIDMSMDLTLVPDDHEAAPINKTRNTTANISIDSITANSSNRTKDSTANMATDSTPQTTPKHNTSAANSTLDGTINMETSMSTTTNSNLAHISNQQDDAEHTIDKETYDNETTLKNIAGEQSTINETTFKNTTLNNTTLRNATANNTSINLVANINASISHGYTLDENDILDYENSFGAFHDSNNMSVRTSGFETLMENMDALTDRYQKVEHELEECRHRLDSETEELFKFYRHVVSEDDRYEFAIAILGLRHSLWLWFKIDPDTYPNEKLNVRLVSHKKDRNLYPLKDYVRTVLRFTKEGHHGYLTKFVINAQRFKRLLRKVGYGRSN